MNLCIGIVSYLPDEPKLRAERANRLQNLIIKCNKYLKLPIIIIAQNWKNFSINTETKVIVYKYKDKLGITKARSCLRKYFLDSSYDYMLMIDDDMILTDDASVYKEWEKFIKNLVCECYLTKGFFINFSLISKKGFEKVKFNLAISAEKLTGYEDVIFTDSVKKYLNWEFIPFKLPKFDRSHFLNDTFSTWDTHDKNKAALNSMATKVWGSKL